MEDAPLFNGIVNVLKTAPDGQLDEGWRKRCADFNGTEAEAYDFLAELHDKACCGASEFIRTLTDVRRFYPRPVG